MDLRQQVARLADLKKKRDNAKVAARLNKITEIARTGENLARNREALLATRSCRCTPERPH